MPVSAKLPLDGRVYHYPPIDFVQWLNDVTWSSEWPKYRVTDATPPAPVARPATPRARRVSASDAAGSGPRARRNALQKQGFLRPRLASAARPRSRRRKPPAAIVAAQVACDRLASMRDPDPVAVIAQLNALVSRSCRRVDDLLLRQVLADHRRHQRLVQHQARPQREGDAAIALRLRLDNLPGRQDVGAFPRPSQAPPSPRASAAMSSAETVPLAKSGSLIASVTRPSRTSNDAGPTMIRKTSFSGGSGILRTLSPRIGRRLARGSNPLADRNNADNVSVREAPDLDAASQDYAAIRARAPATASAAPAVCPA